MNPNTQLFSPSPQNTSALVQIESSRAVQEVQAALVIAKRFPRDQMAAMDRIKNACQRPSLANVAVYQYARGGTDITGPSIRLAEAIAQQWGNLTFGFTELEQSGGASTCEAFCWDLETNTKRSVTFQVPHMRYTKKDGNKPLSDPRDIYELVANNASRRVRACILATIPGDVVESALDQCDETMRADADVSPDAQKKILVTFEKYGIKKEQIEKRIQRRLDAIQPAQVVSLRKIAASLKDGMSKADEWFETEVANAENSQLLKKHTEKKTSSHGDLVLDSSAPSPRETFLAKVQALGVSWSQVGEVLHQNGVLNDARATAADCEDGEIAFALASWDKLSQLVKGGSK